MSDPVFTPCSEPSTLYAKLLGETATLSWQELQPFFARGAVLKVAGSLDLVAVAEALATDDKDKVAPWLTSGELGRLEVAHAEDYQVRDPRLWAVVVAPWVLVQEREAAPALH
ncbi:DUF2288 domain-containing protein [Pseudomonas stutzeri]|nr:DUF2288 domain-containing protein [Stutzerimonas stutzeri]